LENLDVSTQKVQARLPRTLADPAGEHNHPGIFQDFIVPSRDAYRVGKGGRMKNILGLGLSQFRVQVDQDNLAG
jgi:hypothetical protein